MKEADKPKPAPADTFGAYITRFFTSSIGAKVLMAVTGLGLVIFIIGHLVGNLLIFGGPDATNGYARALHANQLFLWTARVGIIVLFLAHILGSLRTKLWDRESRPVRYAVDASRKASFASRTMLITGLLILAFLVYHLAHFTLGWTHPEEFAKADPLNPEAGLDVYRMIVLGFTRPGVSILYGIAMVFLGLHMSHGISSMFQHVGLWGERFARFIRAAGVAVAVAIAVLFVLIPAAILLGIIA